MSKLKVKKIEEALNRRVVAILPSKEGLKKLMLTKRIRLYFGVDPTSPDIHLGHAISLRKLKEFQELGHEVILLFGTFTAQIGDPSGREEQRKPLSLKEVEKNMTGYKKQASKILNLAKIKIKKNDEWLSRLTLQNLNKITSSLTVSRLLERDMFQKRLQKGGAVWLNEFFYPLLQGYDSLAMNVDLEVGGTDQTFNMLVGRELQKTFNKKDKFILTTPLLPGLDGRKMSKTYSNTVNIKDKPGEMYGKIMSLKDELIVSYFNLCTDLSLAEVKQIEKDLKQKKLNPRDLKSRLARAIVGLYHGFKAAKVAEKEFEKVFQKRELPTKIPKVKISQKKIPILELLVLAKLASSKSEAKRFIIQNGVKIDGRVFPNWKNIILAKKGTIIQVGKRKFAQLS